MESQNRTNEARIFIAGATGVIGRRVVPSLVKMGYRISAIGRSPQSRQKLERLGVTPVELDLFDAAAVRRAVAGHEVVINLATSITIASAGRLRLTWLPRRQPVGRGATSRNPSLPSILTAASAGSTSRFRFARPNTAAPCWMRRLLSPISPNKGA
jgi:hypothetical protein